MSDTTNPFLVAAQKATGGAAPAPQANPFVAAAQNAIQPEAGYGSLIDAAADRHGLDRSLLHALVGQESGGNATIVSPKGAVGLGQLMPATARMLGVTDPTDPAQNIEGAAKYLAQNLKAFGGDVSKALAAYNAGPGAVRKYGGIPPYQETQNYVARIMAKLGNGSVAGAVAAATQGPKPQQYGPARPTPDQDLAARVLRSPGGALSGALAVGAQTSAKKYGPANPNVDLSNWRNDPAKVLAIRQMIEQGQSPTLPDPGPRPKDPKAYENWKRRSAAYIQASKDAPPSNIQDLISEVGPKVWNAALKLSRAKDNIGADLAKTAQSVGQTATGIVPNLIRDTSSQISKGLGNGAIDPSIYENDTASRVATKAAELGQYFVPGVGQVAAVGGLLGLGGSAALDPVGTAKGLVQSLNFAEPGITGDERFFRLANLGLTALGAYHGVKAGVGVLNDGLAARKLVTDYGVEPAQAREAIKAAKETLAQHEARTGQPITDPAAVARLSQDLQAQAAKRGQGKAPPVLSRFAVEDAPVRAQKPAVAPAVQADPLRSVPDTTPATPQPASVRTYNGKPLWEATESEYGTGRSAPDFNQAVSEVAQGRGDGFRGRLSDVIDDPKLKTLFEKAGNVEIDVRHMGERDAILRGLSDADRQNIEGEAHKGFTNGLYVQDGNGGKIYLFVPEGARLETIEHTLYHEAAHALRDNLGRGFDSGDAEYGTESFEKSARRLADHALKTTGKPHDEAILDAYKNGADVPKDALDWLEIMGHDVPTRPEKAAIDSPLVVEKPTPAAVPPAPEEVTGLSMAQRTKEAETLGTAKPERVKQTTNKDAHAIGKSKVESGDVDPEALVRDLSSKNRAATPEEYGSILEGRRRLLKEINRTKSEVDAAVGTADHAGKLQAYETAKARAAEFDGHLDRVKGASGGSLQALKIGTVVDTGDFAQVVQEARRNKGSNLSPKEEARIKALVDRHNAELAALEKAHGDDLAKVKAEAESAVKESGATFRKTGRRSKDVIRAERSQAWEAFKTKTVRAETEALAATGEIRLNSGIRLLTEEQTHALATIVKGVIEEGAGNLAEVIAKVQAGAKEAGVEPPDERSIAEVAANRHLAASTPSEAQVRKSNIAATAKIAAKMHDLMEGVESGKVNPKTVDSQVKAMRDALRKLEESKGLGRKTDPEANVRRALDKALSDYAHGVKEKAAPPVDTPEVAQLRKRLAEVRERQKAKNAPAAEAKRLEAVATNLEARLKAREAALAGDYRTRDMAPKGKPATTDRIQAAREALSDVNRRLKVDDTAAELERQLRENDFPGSKPQKAKSEDLQRRQENVALLRKQIQQAIENAKPQGAGEKARIFTRAGMLGNPVSRLFDLTSNAVTYADRQVSKPLESVVDRVLFPRVRAAEGAASPGWSLDRASGVAKGAGSRWKNELREQMLVGDPQLIKKIGSGDLRTKNDALNLAVNRINRFAGTTDIPFKDSVYEGALRELADAKARTELGKQASADAVSARREQIVREAKDGTGHQDVEIVAQNEAIEALFGGDSWGGQLISDVQNAIKKRVGPSGQLVVDLIAPFPRIISNVAGYTNDYLSGIVKAGSRVARGRISGEFDIAQRRVVNRLVARNLRGLGLMAIGYYGYQNGMIKGKVGGNGTYVDYGDLQQALGPVGTVIMLGATMAAAQEIAGDDPEKGKKLIRNTSVSLLVDQPAISGPTKLVSNLQNDPGKAAGQMVTRPFGLMRAWARYQDQLTTGHSQRKTHGFTETVSSAVPGLRQTLEPGD